MLADLVEITSTHLCMCIDLCCEITTGIGIQLIAAVEGALWPWWGVGPQKVSVLGLASRGVACARYSNVLQ